MKKIIQARAPVRIDFAGGTTDIFPFTKKHGGAVLNAAINRYVIGKIIKTDKNVHLEYAGNTPTSSGLGTSGVMNLVWMSLISQIKTKNKGQVSFKDKTELAEKVYKLEQSMGLVGGKQDQYAAAFGGINFLEFKNNEVKVNSLNLNKKFIRELENKLVLVYMGKPHFSGTSNKLMVDNFLKGKNTKHLLEIKKIAYNMKDALKNKDLELFADLMNQETNQRKKLHNFIVGRFTKNFIKKGFNNCASAVKVCGSGGGGSLLFFTEHRNKLKKAFGNKVIDFKFDFEGLKLS